MTTNQANDHEEEQPLDPVLEKVRRKMIRLMVVSIGIMFAAVMAVFIAIVYKTKETATEITEPGTQAAIPSDAPVATTVNLPAGFRVEETSLSDNRILFYGRTAEGLRKAFVFDIATSSLIAEVTLSGN